MESLRIYVSLSIVFALVICGYFIYYPINSNLINDSDNFTCSTSEERLINEISELASYHYKKEVEINRSWVQQINSCVGAGMRAS